MTVAGNNETDPFGIRTFEFSPDNRFWLNGRNLKLNAACLRADGGAFGTRPCRCQTGPGSWPCSVRSA